MYTDLSTYSFLRHTKRKKLYVISTLKRPVPLKHFLYTGNSKQTSDQLFEIVGEEKKFITKGYMTNVILPSVKIWLAEGIHVLHVSLHSYKAALEAKKERTSKVAASYGPKVRYQGNPKQVCMLQCHHSIMRHVLYIV